MLTFCGLGIADDLLTESSLLHFQETVYLTTTDVISTNLDSLHIAPLWFLVYLLLHVVIGLGLYPVVTVMAGRVCLVHLRPSLLINGNQYHA